MMYEIKCGGHSDKSTLQLELYKQLFELGFPRAINNPFNETLKGVDLMIDTKAFMEVCQKRTDLMAQIHVQQTLANVALAGMERCKQDRNFSQMQAWHDAAQIINAKLLALTEELKDVTRQMEAM